MQSDPGLGKKLKRAAYKVKTKIRQAQQQRNVAKIMKEKASESAGKPKADDLGQAQINKGQGKFVRDVERAKKKDAMKRKIKSSMGKIGDFLGDKAGDMRANISKRRYEKGRGPRGERATESGSATDEQVCGPDGKCKTKSPRGLGSRRN